MGRRKTFLILTATLLGLSWAAHAHAAEAADATSAAVPLDRRTWALSSAPAPRRAGFDVSAHDVSRAPGLGRSMRRARLALSADARDEAWVRTSAQTEASSRGGERSVAHAPDLDTSRFHVTALRLWAYRSFLPKSDDSDILGIELNSAWSWGRLDFSNISYIEVVDYPRAVPGMPAGNPVPTGGTATGVTDLLSALLVSPKSTHHGPHHWAAGLAVQLPTASDPTIGSEKWSIGPAVEYEYHKGRFFAAFVALQLWSVAGADDRKAVNMLMVKPMITYELSRRWKAVYMPYGISVYWDKPSGDRVYLPVGGGFQYEFCAWRQEMAVSLQFFKYVLRPSKGTEYDLRLMVEFDF